MGVFRVQRVTLPKSGLARDQVVNTFHFQTPLQDTANPTDDQRSFVRDALNDLYGLAVGSGSALRTFLAESTMASQRAEYKFYNLDHATPRQPIGGPQPAQNITPVIATAPLPSEVALCLSFRGNAVSGTNMARRRGRIFIGPLNTAAVESDPITGQARPVLALQNAAVQGANRLADAMALVGMIWSIYSPALRAAGSGSALSGTTDIKHAWCDNAFDTQRRRGQNPSGRVALDV